MIISIITPGGYTNFGERAIMLGTVVSLRKKYPQAKIAIFGYKEIDKLDPPLSDLLKENTVEYHDIVIKGEKRSEKILSVFKLLLFPKWGFGYDDFEILKQSELIIAKGQESFTNSYGLVHFIDSILEIFIVSKINKNITLLGHSIGPVQGWLQKFIAKMVLNNVKEIDVRDSVSKKQLIELGYPLEHIKQIQDLAYTAIQKYYAPQVLEKTEYYFIVPNAALLQHKHSEVYLKNLSKIIEHLTSKSEKILLGSSVIASDWNNDYNICERLHNLYPNTVIKKFLTLNEFVDVVKKSKVLITSRLHPSIFAHALNKK